MKLELSVKAFLVAGIQKIRQTCLSIPILKLSQHVYGGDQNCKWREISWEESSQKQTASLRKYVQRLYERKEKKTYLVTATGNLARSIFLGQGLDLTNVEGSFKSVSCGLLQGYIFLR